MRLIGPRRGMSTRIRMTILLGGLLVGGSSTTTRLAWRSRMLSTNRGWPTWNSGSARAVAWLTTQRDPHRLTFSPHALTMAMALLALSAPEEHEGPFESLFPESSYDVL